MSLICRRHAGSKWSRCKKWLCTLRFRWLLATWELYALSYVMGVQWNVEGNKPVCVALVWEEEGNAFNMWTTIISWHSQQPVFGKQATCTDYGVTQFSWYFFVWVMYWMIDRRLFPPSTFCYWMWEIQLCLEWAYDILTLFPIYSDRLVSIFRNVSLRADVGFNCASSSHGSAIDSLLRDILPKLVNSLPLSRPDNSRGTRKLQSQ